MNISKDQGEATHHDQFTLDVSSTLKTIVILPLAQGSAVDICSEETHRRLHPLVEGTAIRQVSTKTHPSRTDAPIARGE